MSRGKRFYVLLLLLALFVSACAAPPMPEEEPSATEEPVATSEEPVEEEPFVPPEETAPTATPAPLPTNEAVSAPALDPLQSVEVQLERLTGGKILYNPPTQMVLGRSERVEVRLSRSITQTLTEGLKGRGEAQTEAVPVATFMKVRLVGDSFTITPLSSEEQIVMEEGFTEWAWDVTPQRRGQQTLSLVVTARIKLPEYDDEQKDLGIIERDIRVQVNPGFALQAFVTNNREWIYPVVVIPAALALWRMIRRRFGKRETPAV